MKRYINSNSTENYDQRQSRYIGSLFPEISKLLEKEGYGVEFDTNLTTIMITVYPLGVTQSDGTYSFPNSALSPGKDEWNIEQEASKIADILLGRLDFEDVYASYEPEGKTDREQWDDYYNDIKDMPEARDPFEVDTYCIQKYDKYPIYEPAEGGYYYEGLEPDTYETFPTMKAAVDALEKLVEGDNKGMSSNEEGYLVLSPDRRNAYTINHTYIGEGNEYYIEPINRRGYNATGKVPYQ